MKSLLYCIIFLLLAMTGELQASCYGPDGQITEYQQPGGRKLSLRVFGNEYYARTETPEGYTVIFNRGDLTYYYAQVSADGETLESTGIKADAVAPAGLAKHQTVTPAIAAKLAQTRRDKFDAERAKLWEKRIKGVRAKLNREAGFAPSSGGDAARQAAAAEIEAAPVNGSKVGLTILVQFPDDPQTTAVDPTSFPTTQAKIQRFCNNIGYTEDNNTGSVRDYFSDQSNGALDYTQSVTEIVTLPNARNFYNFSDYPANKVLRDGGLTGRMVTQDAVTILKNNGFNFGNLTVNPANNRILATNILFAGATSGVWPDGLWPHRWAMSGSGINVGTAQAPRYVYDYQITNVINAAPVIGTFCHENGHLILGYPDLYDSNPGNGESSGVGSHCLMGSGNHNNGGRTPAPINIAFKDYVAWGNVTDLTTAQGVIASLPSTGNVGRRIRKPGLNSEYFIVENRGNGDKWATSVPDKGICIWHIDETKNGNGEQQMTAAQHYEVSLEQADGEFDLENGRGGDSTDLFDSNNPDFNDYTTPNADWWNGAASGIKIRVTSAAGANMNVEFGQLLPANTIDVTSPKAGQVLYKNSNANITWGANIVGNVKIELLKNNIPQSVIAANEVNDGSYTWTIPAGAAIASDYSIRISSVNNPAYSDVSEGFFEIKNQPTLADALDTPALVWTTSGHANWFEQSLISHDGSDAAQSGDIAHNQTSTLQTTVTGPCTLSFWWKISSESNYDFLRFYLDDVEQTGSLARISGIVDWTQKSIAIPAGNHTLKWSYTKDGSVDANEDTAWLDQVTISAPNSGTWTNLAGGTWQTSGNWLNNVIGNGVGHTADFSTLNITANAMVTLDGARTIGNLIFGDTSPSHNWLLNTGTDGPLTLDVTSGSPTITINNQATTIGLVIAGNKGLTKAGPGTLTLTGTNTYTGATNVSAGTLRLGDGIIQPTLQSTYTIAANSTLRVQYNTNGATAQTWSKYTGAGTLALETGKNFDNSWGTAALGSSFTGTLLIEGGRVTATNASGNGLGGTTHVIVTSGGQFGMWNGGIFNQNFTIEGTGYGEGNGYDVALRFSQDGISNTLNGNIALTGNATVGAKGSGVATLNGIISGAASSDLTFGTSTLNGTVILTGANTYAGRTIVSAGTLEIAGAGKLGNGNYSNSIVNGGAFRHSSSANQTLSGAITGTGTLSKSGSATLTLSGANSYSGSTTLSGGILNITGTLTQSAVTVQNNATLGGSGTLGKTTTVLAGGTISPGVSNIGTLTITQTLNLAGTAQMQVHKAGNTLTSDKLSGISTLTYGGILNVIHSGDSLVAGDTFTLFGAATYGGAFTSVNLPTLSNHLKWDTSKLTINGTIQVRTKKPIESWQQAKFGSEAENPAVAGPNADTDGDGIKQLMEYALNADPHVADLSNLPTVSQNGDNIILVYRKNLAATDVSYIVEESTGLTAWNTAIVSETILSDNGSTRVIKASAAKGGAARKFLRLKVILTP